MPTAVFVLITLISGAKDGIVAWLFREYVPTKRLDWINAALHGGGGLVYAVVVALVWALAWAWAIIFDAAPIGWPLAWTVGKNVVVQALLTRWLLFDVVLNLTRSYFDWREGQPFALNVFAVGEAAISDRLTRWAAARLHLAPSVLRFICWLLALGLLLFFVFTPSFF
jgi:hypothetical protein